MAWSKTLIRVSWLYKVHKGRVQLRRLSNSNVFELMFLKIKCDIEI